MSVKPALKAQPARGNAFRATRKVSENSELFKKPEPGTQFLWERILSSDQLSRFSCGSEAMPTTNSRYSSFLQCERSLDPGRLRKAVRHSAKNGASPLGLRQLSALGLDFKRERPSSLSVPTPYLSSGIDPGKLIFQRANDSQDQAFTSSRCKDVHNSPVYGPSGFDLRSTIWRGIVSVPPLHRGPTGRGSTDNR